MPEPRNWTVDEEGRSNASAEFLRLEGEIAALIRSPAISRMWAESTARLILAHLAHVHNFGPLASADPGGEDREHGS